MNKYDFRKYSFSERIVDLCNCVLTCVVSSSFVDSFKRNLDKFWCNQESIKGNHNRNWKQKYCMIDKV